MKFGSDPVAIAATGAAVVAADTILGGALEVGAVMALAALAANVIVDSQLSDGEEVAEEPGLAETSSVKAVDQKYGGFGKIMSGVSKLAVKGPEAAVGLTEQVSRLVA